MCNEFQCAGPAKHWEQRWQRVLGMFGGLPRLQPCHRPAVQPQLSHAVHRAMAAAAGDVCHLSALQAHRLWHVIVQLMARICCFKASQSGLQHGAIIRGCRRYDTDCRASPGSLPRCLHQSYPYISICICPTMTLYPASCWCCAPLCAVAFNMLARHDRWDCYREVLSILHAEPTLIARLCG